MAKSHQEFKTEHEAFRARLRKIHEGPIGVAARNAMNGLRAAYTAAALEHWRELGNRASTGWGPIPEADYRSTQTPEQCADHITNVLAQYFANDPNDPPGSMAERVGPTSYRREVVSSKKDELVDLEKLEPVSIAEVAKSPNKDWNPNARAPELFEQWWAKHGDKHWSVKHAAREGWYACAESLGVYEQ